MKLQIVAIVSIVMCLVGFCDIIKGNAGARNIVNSQNSREEEQLYKQLFLQLASDTLPTRLELPIEVWRFNRNFWLHSSTVEELTILANSVEVKANNIFCYGSPKLATLKFPNLVAYPSWGLHMNFAVSHLNLFIPKVRVFGSKTYCFDPPANKTIRVYINEITCEEIMAIPNFPGLHQSAYARCTFHGSDGTLSWNGSEWVVTNAK